MTDLPLGASRETVAAFIAARYAALGYDAGWRFITCPEANKNHAKMLLVTLNPAGSKPHGPNWSQERGSAYRVEQWEGALALQDQILRLFAFLGLKDAEVFSAQYVPFRSPRWALLPHKPEALEVARTIWRWLLPQVAFDCVVCVGKGVVGKEIAQLMGAEPLASYKLGWGEQTADRYRMPDGRSIVALPHLSQFLLFSRAQCAPNLRTVLFDGGAV